MSVKITIQAIPPSLNRFAGRKNCWEYREQKSRWTALVRQSAPRLRKPLEQAVIKITYFFPTRGRRDPDNYNGKMILDGLVAAGVIRDDSFEHIQLSLRGQTDRANPRTEIEIEEG